MEKNLMIQLETSFHSLTKAQRKVADYIIREPLQAAFSTIDQIAHISNVSTTSVVRLALAFGYEGFADFQRDLREYLRTNAAPLKKMMINIYDHEGGSDPHTAADSVIQSITALEIANIEKTYQANSTQLLEKIADEIVSARNIYTCGNRTSYSSAHYLAYNLTRMFKNAYQLDGNTSNTPEALTRIGQGDILIVISLSRYVKSTIQIGAAAKAQGATVVAITDSYYSPFAQYADYQLKINCDTNAFHNTVLSIIYIMDVLLNLCSHKRSSEIRANLKELEQLVVDLKIMDNK